MSGVTVGVGLSYSGSHPLFLMKRGKSNRARNFGSRRPLLIGASEAPSETHPAVDHPGESIEAAWKWVEEMGFEAEQPHQNNGELSRFQDEN